jgi:hypothetical protein
MNGPFAGSSSWLVDMTSEVAGLIRSALIV